MPEPFKPTDISPPLPRQLTPFVGRQQELGEITKLLLDPACRLLTLVGPGGIGKTRLAIQSASELLNHFTNGLYFVSLQSIQSADLLIPAIANILNVHLSGQQEPQLQLLNYLQDKEMLLLLDTFEQLIDGADLLTDLLQLAPTVKLLITSREALNLPEEWLFPVNGMPYPASPQGEDAEAHSAVQLFVGCARRIRPDFSLADEREGVIDICRLVEGTPLALELAASWVKTLSCADIAAEIQRNLDFLMTRWRGVPSRHQSMKAVFNHSWALLSQEERAVFKRLAVFRGGFRRQAAEQVVGASLATLSALVDKSLLRWEPDGRYQIHELLRQYAAEQLGQSPEDVAYVYDLHARYYTDFLWEQTEALRGGRQREALSEIEAELENVRGAWQWAVEQLKVERIQKTVEVLNSFYDFRGRYLEGVRIFEEARQRLSGQESTRQIALALALLSLYLGGLYVRLGRLEEAEAALIHCQELYRQLDTPPPPGYATDPVFILGVIASIRGDYAKAARLGEQALQTSKTHNHLLNQQMACYLLGRAALLQGQDKIAQEYIQQSYELTQKTKDRWFMAYCLNELGNVAYALGNYETAREHYTVSYDLRKEFDDPEGMAVALNHLGEVTVRQENYAEAQRLYQQSLVISQEINNQGGIATALNGLGRTALALKDYPTARRQFSQALQIAGEVQFVSLILSLLVGIGELMIQTGQTEQGLELLALALHHPSSESETKEEAQQKLSRYQVDLSSEPFAAARQRGQNSDLKAIITSIQTELTPPFTAKKHGSRSVEMQSVSPAPPYPRTSPLVEPLTEREVEVLHLMADGLSNPEIAEKLVLAVGTVKYYTSEIYGKLGVRNRMQAVARARELGLL